MNELKAQDCVRTPAGDEDEGAGLPVVRHGAAGIDLGSEVHWVCAPKANGQGREVATFKKLQDSHLPVRALFQQVQERVVPPQTVAPDEPQ